MQKISQQKNTLKRRLLAAFGAPVAALASAGDTAEAVMEPTLPAGASPESGAPQAVNAQAAAAKAPRVKADADAKFRTTVGGQAVMEGIMMRGPERWALSVRKPDGEIVTEEHDVVKRPWAKWPFLRGIFNFVDSILMGYKTLMRSAELALAEGEEEQQEQPSKFDAFMEKHLGEKALKAMMVLATVLGVVLAMGLFMYLPTAFVWLMDNFVVQLGGFKTLIEGLIKIVLFIAYLAVVSQAKDIKRVFRYHGAEHKTIACYEAGDDLTVENVRKKTRFHPRCGTSFLLIVLVLSILVFSILPWGNALVRVALKLLMLPVVMGLAYEVIRLAGRYTNPLTRAISAPGMWLQRLTTAEPDDTMIEVALTAVSPVLPKDPGEAKW